MRDIPSCLPISPLTVKCVCLSYRRCALYNFLCVFVNSCTAVLIFSWCASLALQVYQQQCVRSVYFLCHCVWARARCLNESEGDWEWDLTGLWVYVCGGWEGDWQAPLYYPDWLRKCSSSHLAITADTEVTVSKTDREAEWAREKKGERQEMGSSAQQDGRGDISANQYV